MNFIYTRKFIIIAISLTLFFLNACVVSVYEDDILENYNHKIKKGWQQEGKASWYGPKFHGKTTANGETYDMYAYTAAHRTLPFNTVLLVINQANSKEVQVRVNDKEPFIRGRIIDLSYEAAKKLDMISAEYGS